MSFTEQSAASATEEDTETAAVPADTSADPPSLLEYPATYTLIGTNLLVFAVMSWFGPVAAVLHAGWSHGHSAGAGWMGHLLTAPFSENLLTAFGSCNPDRVLLGGQWWRLVTSTFVHVTPLHLLLNMWCLWNLGLFGERLLGRPGLIAVYVLTGAAGMLQSVLGSLWSGHLDVIVAGASGAVFGLAGILIVLLSNRRLAAPWEQLRSLRRQVIFFALANLLLGALPGFGPRLFPGLLLRLHVQPGSLPNVDNGAHLGGLLCGLALGLPLLPRMTSGRSGYRFRQALVFGVAALVLVLTSYAVASFARALA